MHGGAQIARLHLLVALELDDADLYLRAFFDVEGDADGGGRNLADFGCDGSELAAVSGEQFLQYDFRLLHASRVKLAFLAQSNLAFLELVENIALRYGVEPNVLDFTNCGFFLDVYVNNPALGALFALNTEVVEIACVPERIEVALHARGIVHISRPGKHAGTDGVRRNAAIAVNS